MNRAAFLSCTLLLLACGGENRKQEEASTAPDPRALRDPSLARETAPAQFRVRFETTKGDFVVEVSRDWAPQGADRFYNLVRIGFFDACYFFRVIPSFMAQFGLHGDPAVSGAWARANIPDDPVKESNQPGYLTFAKTGMPNSRSTQLFINTVNNAFLDGQGFAPIGKVTEGMDVVVQLYSGYGKESNEQAAIRSLGNTYLKENFPELDHIERARVVD